jgi:hypothetical protein
MPKNAAWPKHTRPVHAHQQLQAEREDGQIMILVDQVHAELARHQRVQRQQPRSTAPRTDLALVGAHDLNSPSGATAG